jgi:hypothetical protein
MREFLIFASGVVVVTLGYIGVMRGTIAGRRVVVCDYHYATGGPNDRHDHYHTVAAYFLVLRVCQSSL